MFYHVDVYENLGSCDVNNLALHMHTPKIIQTGSLAQQKIGKHE